MRWWNIVNQLGKHDFFLLVGGGGKQLERQELFSHHASRNRFDPVLTRHDFNCPTIYNLRCLNSALNVII